MLSCPVFLVLRGGLPSVWIQRSVWNEKHHPRVSARLAVGLWAELKANKPDVSPARRRRAVGTGQRPLGELSGGAGYRPVPGGAGLSCPAPGVRALPGGVAAASHVRFGVSPGEDWAL